MSELQPFVQIATISPPATGYEDVDDPPANEIWYDSEVSYRLRTVEDGVSGEPGLVDTGYRILEPVSNINATDGLYYDRVEITWEPSLEADKYRVLYQQTDIGGTGLGPLAEIEDVSVTSFTHSLSNPAESPCVYGAPYVYDVEALIEIEEGFYYAEWSTGPDTGFRLLNPPAGVTGSGGVHPDRIELAWDKADGATGYLIYRDGKEPADVVATLGDVDTWTDYPVDFATHTYWLRSTADECVSEYSLPAVGRRNRWQTHAVDVWTIPKAYPLAVLDGKPIIACCNPDAAGPDLSFGQATSSAPGSSSDWVFHVVDDEFVEAGLRGLCMAVVDGKPAIVFGLYSGDALMYARALTTTPTSSSDWQIHEVDTGEWAGYSCSLVELDGRPAVAYLNRIDFGTKVYFARTTVAEPASAADWSVHAIEDTDIIGTVSLVVYGGLPVIAHERGRPKICRATTATPGSAADWQCHGVGEYVQGEGSWVSLAVVAGRLAVAYNNDNETQLQYARATVPAPVTSSDWVIQAVDPDLAIIDGAGSLIEFNGVPAIGYCQGLGPKTGAIVRAAIASGAEPGGQEDWGISAVQYAGDDYPHSDAITLAVCGGALIGAYQYSESGLMFALRH